MVGQGRKRIRASLGVDVGLRMRTTSLVMASLLAAGVLAAPSAQAFDRYDHVPRMGSYADRYRYEYEPRGYYPFYNSGYWVPTRTLKNTTRYHFRLPKYYPSWGGPRKYWDNNAWHAAHDGRNWPWHW